MLYSMSLFRIIQESSQRLVSEAYFTLTEVAEDLDVVVGTTV